MKRKSSMAAGVFLAALLWTVPAAADMAKGGEQREPEMVLAGLIFPSRSESYGAWTGGGAEKLLADTGIRLEFYSNGNGASLKQYMAAGTLPDFMGVETSQAELLKNADLLLNLDDYREFLPAVYENQAYEKALSYGRESFGGEKKGLYLLPLEVGKQGKEEYNWVPMLQWKPYEQAGCQELTTLWDYLDVVEEMLRQKPITPLGDRVYGFSLFGEKEDCMIEEAAALSYLYGVDIGLISPLIEMDGKTRELQRITAENSFYKKALEFYFEANKRGLLDPDSRTQTFDGLKQKYDRGRILFANYSWIVEDYNQSDEFKSTDYVPVIASDMKLYREPGVPTGTDLYFGVSRNTANPKKACEFLNWLYEEETISYLYSHPEEMEPFEALGLSKAQAGVKEEPLAVRKDLEDGLWEESSIETYVLENDMIQEGSGAVYMLPPDPAGIQNLTRKIGERIRDLSWDMIYAPDKKSFELLWKQLQEESRLLGIEELEGYYQEVWAEALKKEEAYGETS